MKENGFKLEKIRSRRYLAQTITDADYADDIPLLENTPAQAESLLHYLEQAAGCIGLHVNADERDYIWFNQREDIPTVNGGSLKLVDKFTYLGSSVLSSKNDINTRQAIDWLSVIWKSDLSDKKNAIFPSSSRVHTTIRMHRVDAD